MANNLICLHSFSLILYCICLGYKTVFSLHTMELEFRNRKIILRESIGLETNGLLDILSTGMFRVYTI